MIEREFIAQKTKEFYIRRYIENKLKGANISQIKLKKIPLGEKIIIYTNRPSLIIGSKGANIKDLTKTLKQNFKLENPQIEISEVKDVFLDATIIAERIASSLERFGAARFKSIGHKIMENVLNSGALGIEVIISGKIPSARARSWRFYQGYLKKCGDIARTGVRHAQTAALLKSGIIGVKVSIMPSDLSLPDSIEVLSEPIKEVEEIKKESPKKKSSRKSSVGKRKKSPAGKSTGKKKEKAAVPEKEGHLLNAVLPNAEASAAEKEASEKATMEKSLDVSEASEAAKVNVTVNVADNSKISTSEIQKQENQ